MYRDLIIASETSRCMLCHEASCSKACVKGLDPASAIFSLRFKNEVSASEQINIETCKDCYAPCEKACVHFDTNIKIKKISGFLTPKKSHKKDLSIDFCGVKCENPFFLSSSVVASGYDMIAKAFDMGWSGMVYKTIGFYKPKEVSPRFDVTSSNNRSFESFKNMEQISDKSLDENLEILKKLKANYPNKIIVSSIMGQTEEEWTKLAKLSQEANCDIIECNFSCPHMSAHGLGSDVGTNPELVEKYTKAARKGTKLPILAKMTPNLANMETPAIVAIKAGADGLAAINTIKSLNSANAVVDGKSAVSGLSGRNVKPIALRFISDMAKCKDLQNVPISGMGGIENYLDAIDFIKLGCSNIQITTSVMEYGYRIIDDLIHGFSEYMYQENIDKVEDIVGVALENIINPDTLNRESIVYPKFDKSKCVNCKRCYISCFDAGHQAIKINEKGKIILIANKCVGCHLCKLVCPVNAIGQSKRFEIKNL
ncbi:MAG: NAD-dependent dihydropyrimidine dehydrogenase subunit PreA [Clostridia bacterium]